MPALLDTYNAIAAESNNLSPRRPAIDFAAIALDAVQIQQLPKRDQTVVQGIIPTYYDLSGPKPGTVVGIVMGSVAAFLFVAWLIMTITSGGCGGMATTTMAGEEEVVVRKRRDSQGRRDSHGRRSQASRRHDMREVDRSPRTSGGRSQIIVDERRSSGRRPRSLIVEERRRVPGDDVVEVIEEHDEYRERRGSRRGNYQY